MAWRVVWAVLVALAALSGASVTWAAGEPRFTECVEGSGNNKALEIVNDTGRDVDLSSWQVRFHFNGSASPGATIPLAGDLPSGEVFVLAHAGADPAVLAVADQLAGGSWFNGDDAIALVKDGALADVIGQIGVDPGTAWGSGTASTADHTLRRALGVVAGDANGSDAFVPSAEWFGWPGDTFDGLGSYPEPGLVKATLSIPQIQGAAHVSPFSGALVETTGVVTAVDGYGFFLQDPPGDGSLATSDGLFVFTGAPPAVAVASFVRVTGMVNEFQAGGPSSSNLSVTELAASAVELLWSRAPLPEPAILGAAGFPPPAQVIDDDGFALFDPRADGIDWLEAFEGMRVLIPQPVTVSARNGFGEIAVVGDAGALATGLAERGALTLSAADAQPERLQVQLDAQLLPGFDPAVDAGDRLGDVVGVVSYEFGSYDVKATQVFAVLEGGLPPEVAGAAPESTLSVASFNVLNLDPKVESLALVNSFADIDDDVGELRFERLAVQIVTHLRSPDILALEEVQDGDGAEQTALTDAGLTYATLIDAIAAAGGPAYQARDIAPANGSSGGQPGGNIRVGFLFNPARVTLDESSVQALADLDLSDGDAFAHARRPLLARFRFHGRDITLVANHFSSKSGSTPAFGAVQPPVNGSVEQRIAQAEAVAAHVQELLAGDPDAHVVVLGDLNELPFLSPLAVLEGGRSPFLCNLVETLPDAERYSYVFDGAAQCLDHILVSASLAPLATFDVVHVNAEFQDHASDHDPVLARLTFPPVCQRDLGFGGPGSATLSVCGDPLAPSGTSSFDLTLPVGGAGFLVFGLRGAPLATAGGTLVPAGGTLVPVPLSGSFPLVDGDRDGSVSFPLPGAIASAPVSIVVQFVYPDAALSPCGFGFSNAVEIRFVGR
jgi:uncharacterized protein